MCRNIINRLVLAGLFTAGNSFAGVATLVAAPIASIAPVPTVATAPVVSIGPVVSAAPVITTAPVMPVFPISSAVPVASAKPEPAFTSDMCATSEQKKQWYDEYRAMFTKLDSDEFDERIEAQQYFREVIDGNDYAKAFFVDAQLETETLSTEQSRFLRPFIQTDAPGYERLKSAAVAKFLTSLVDLKKVMDTVYQEHLQSTPYDKIDEYSDRLRPRLRAKGIEFVEAKSVFLGGIHIRVLVGGEHYLIMSDAEYLRGRLVRKNGDFKNISINNKDLPERFFRRDVYQFSGTTCEHGPGSLPLGTLYMDHYVSHPTMIYQGSLTAASAAIDPFSYMWINRLFTAAFPELGKTDARWPGVTRWYSVARQQTGLSYFGDFGVDAAGNVNLNPR